MKQYGSAVLTALQAQYMSIEEICKLIPERRLESFIQGGLPEEWLDCFWRNMAILQANKTENKNGESRKEIIYERKTGC